MPGPDQVKELHEKVGELLAKALTDIQRGRTRARRAMEGRFRAAEFLLTEAQEYVDAAWNLLKAGKERASVTVSRWILEAALNLVWVTAKEGQVDKRLELLLAEALRLANLLFKGLADLSPTDSGPLLAQADELRQQRLHLVGKGARNLDSLDRRLRDAIPRGQPVSHPQLYALYRICCADAHPSLALWRRYTSGPGGATVTSASPNSTELAIWMVAASSFHLVGGAYALTDLGDADCLKTWWREQVAPLLGSA